MERMWEYKIYKTDLWWSIYRKMENWKFIYMQFLNWHNGWTTKKEYAKIFYHRDKAESVLIIMKARNEKESD